MQDCNYYPSNRFYQGFVKLIYRFTGWKLTGTMPDTPKFIITVAHHTSNWDFVILLLARILLRMRIRFLAKHTLFKPPLGWFMRYWGGIPIRRDKAHNVVAQVISYFDEQSHCILALTPDGTRGPVSRWKMGFYHMAQGADIPVVPVAINYQSRRIIIGDALKPSGDEAADMYKLHSFYLPHPPRYPQNAWYGPFDKRNLNRP